MQPQTPIVEGSQLQARVEAADHVFLGTILEVGLAPGAWSGRYEVFQLVRYRVDEVLTPGALGSDVEVEHLVVHGSATAHPTEPRLNPELFAPGRTLLVFATRGRPEAPERLRCTSESDGALAAAPDQVASVRALLR